jgi:hypothetical protein
LLKVETVVAGGGCREKRSPEFGSSAGPPVLLPLLSNGCGGVLLSIWAVGIPPVRTSSKGKKFWYTELGDLAFN